ncbi:uncharacterized protein N7482_000972 [Penicillium canariense]|uniref:LysM domain-containing protein n=1 Tax=Penicillium canariense TaxID=189055 RepID=A0A9W9ID21_9EURO|nr:uncharacterized protein N7482_000972 [Penicillium canariense]KAJ5175095.1 hypothetical protein N7482_000972 [Penicillium canariense]
MTDKLSISRNNLLFLNPELFQNCTNLLADTYYCVQPVGYIATYSGYRESSTSTVPFDETSSTSLPSQPPMIELSATGTGVTTPYPVQTGMVATCDEFYKVIADDSSVDIANANGIPVASFYTWNPAVETDCSGLQAIYDWTCLDTY